jgi:hypothetical protein
MLGMHLSCSVQVMCSQPVLCGLPQLLSQRVHPQRRAAAVRHPAAQPTHCRTHPRSCTERRAPALPALPVAANGTCALHAGA